MFDAARIRDDFSGAASSYAAHAKLQRHVLGTLLRKASSLLTPNARILDAGCGTGRLAQWLAGCDVTQIDLAWGMCAQARAHGPVICTTIERLPFAPHSFDVVFSSLVLQWSGDKERALAQLRRVVKPGGVCAVSMFGEGTLAELSESFTAADAYDHISPFDAGEGWQRETITEYFPTLEAIMRHLKMIGAGNKLAARRKSVMTPRQLQRVQAHYLQRYGTPQGLPVTWNILYKVGIV